MGYSLADNPGKSCRFNIQTILFSYCLSKSFINSTGTPPSTEVPYDNYPIVVNPVHDPSATVLVVQDYTFGKYLGRLDVEFDDEGRVVSFAGNPISQGKSIL